MTANDMKTWDIFCRVIDNYGDIGVCWRLARQLANEYPFQVRLWVDELPALTQIWPATQNTEQQSVENVDVRIWQPLFAAEVEPADVVIEAFACNLPDSYLAAMKRKTTPPYWFNLEYLSAEDWVEGCHGLLSTHPQLGLKKTFFFPGFTAKTGGLLKEKSLFEERDNFLSQPKKRSEFLRQLGVTNTNDALIVSLFGYENNALASLLDTWMRSSTPILCLVPPSKILPNINAHVGKMLVAGDEFIQGSMRLKVIPFLTQTDYDRLLWVCDINFIRGEDSFVRAQWAAKPFIWNIYPQEDDVHIVKLDAFLGRYLQNLEPDAQAAITQLWHHWNRGADCQKSWDLCMDELKTWQEHSQNWCHTLSAQGDLASNLVNAVNKKSPKNAVEIG